MEISPEDKPETPPIFPNFPEFNLTGDGNIEPQPESENSEGSDERVDWRSVFEESAPEAPESNAGGGGSDKPPQEPPIPSEPGEPDDHIDRWESELRNIEILELGPGEGEGTKRLFGSVWEALEVEYFGGQIMVNGGEAVVTNENHLIAIIEPGEYGVAIKNPSGPELGLMHFESQEAGGPETQLSLPRLDNLLESMKDTFGEDATAIVFSPASLSEDEITSHAEQTGLTQENIKRGTADRMKFWGEMIEDAVKEGLGPENVSMIQYGELQSVVVGQNEINLIGSKEGDTHLFVFRDGQLVPEVTVAPNLAKPRARFLSETSRADLVTAIKESDWLRAPNGDKISTEESSYDLAMDVDNVRPQEPIINLKLMLDDSNIAEASASIDDYTLHVQSLPDKAVGDDPAVSLSMTLTDGMYRLAMAARCDRITVPDARSMFEVYELQGPVSPEQEVDLLNTYDHTAEKLGFFHDSKNKIWYKRLFLNTQPWTPLGE